MKRNTEEQKCNGVLIKCLIPIIIYTAEWLRRLNIDVDSASEQKIKCCLYPQHYEVRNDY